MDSLYLLSQDVGNLLLDNKQILVTAESCTGGGVAAAITEVAGSSAWFDRAFVTYSNDAKQQMVGVKAETLSEFGAVSEPVVFEMVQGALANSAATVGVSISGIAGPSGGSDEKPVGTVCFAWADKSGWLHIETKHFSGNRGEVREQAVEYALQTLKEYFLSRTLKTN